MRYEEADMVLNEFEERKIEKLLLGHSIVEVICDSLFLDDGTELEVVANEGCICGAGWYEVEHLEKCDNAITNVEFECVEEENKWGYEQTVYKIFVLAYEERINILSVAGDDGNGYYGTGYEIYVKFPEREEK